MSLIFYKSECVDPMRSGLRSVFLIRLSKAPFNCIILEQLLVKGYIYVRFF